MKKIIKLLSLLLLVISFNSCESVIEEPVLKLKLIQETVTQVTYLREYSNRNFLNLKEGYPVTQVTINYYRVATLEEIKKQNVVGVYNMRSTFIERDGKLYALYQDITYVYEILEEY